MVESNYLISLDPGKTTGFASGTWGRDEIFMPKDYGDVEGLTVEEYFDVLHVLQSSTTKPVTVVCEDFILQRGRAMTSDQTTPTYLIGALQYVAYMNPNITLVLQKPSEAKQGVKDEHLDNLGLLLRPKTRMNHMNDALRHAIYYLKRNKHMPTLEGGFK